LQKNRKDEKGVSLLWYFYSATNVRQHYYEHHILFPWMGCLFPANSDIAGLQMDLE